MSVLFAIALALRLPGLLGQAIPLTGDEPDYHALALRLFEGRGYVNAAGAPTAWRTPGLPVVLSLVYAALGPDPAGARAVLAFASSLASPLLYGLSTVLFRRRLLAFLAGVIWAALPTSRVLAGELLNEPLVVPALLFGVLATVLAEHRRSAALAIVAGLALGSAVLFRAFLLPAVLGAPAWLGGRKARGLAIILVVAIAVLPGAWAARNAVQLGVFTVTTQGSLEFWQGNNAWARGSWPGDWAPQQAYLQSEHPELSSLGEVGFSQLLLQEGLHEIVDHPARTLWLLPRKAVIFFSPSSYLGFDWLYAALLPFAIVGVVDLVLKRQDRHLLWLLGFPVLAVLAVCLVVFGDPRFRHPVDPFLVLLSVRGGEKSGRRLASMTRLLPARGPSRVAVSDVREDHTGPGR